MHFTNSDVMHHIANHNISVEVYETVPSTNTMLKQRGHMGAPQGLVIAAESQTAGRGRMGREFYSPTQTGAYFSVLLRPKLSPEDCLLITTCAAVAVARVLEQITGKEAKIKWVNDIYIDDRKVCGILTEASFSSNTIDFAVLGIGINISTPENGFPEEIREKAGSLFPSCESDIRPKLIAKVLNEFFAMYDTIESKDFIKEYQSRSMLDGKAITVINPNSLTPATAMCIDDELALVVRYENGKIEHLTSGDVSIGRA